MTHFAHRAAKGTKISRSFSTAWEVVWDVFQAIFASSNRFPRSRRAVAFFIAKIACSQRLITLSQIFSQLDAQYHMAVSHGRWSHARAGVCDLGEVGWEKNLAPFVIGY
jgi:hypothetical protein